MNIRIAAAAVCAFVGVGVAGIAIAQTMWPQITASDLQACRNVIAQAHKKQQGVISAEITQYCTAGSRDYQADSCASMRQWMNESKAQDDVAWYVKGQSSCEGGDYPCYGPEIFNDPRTGSDVAYSKRRSLREPPSRPTWTSGTPPTGQTIAPPACG